MVQWWRQLESDLAAVGRVIQREHQAAIVAGTPWPPERMPRPERVPEPESSPGSDPEADGQRSSADDRAGRLNLLLGQADEAAERFAVENADREAKAEYAARLEREAYEESERTLQVEASYEADIEL
jgi:hypothetical protein